MPHQVAERDRRRVAAVLAADAHLQVRLGDAAALHGHLHHRADALPVQHLERIVLQDALLDVLGEKHAGIVARVAEHHLVRSLVPKEKKSAASATRSAVTAARGISIMVPIW